MSLRIVYFVCFVQFCSCTHPSGGVFRVEVVPVTQGQEPAHFLELLGMTEVYPTPPDDDDENGRRARASPLGGGGIAAAAAAAAAAKSSTTHTSPLAVSVNGQQLLSPALSASPTPSPRRRSSRVFAGLGKL